jgi:hypothetical protein
VITTISAIFFFKVSLALSKSLKDPIISISLDSLNIDLKPFLEIG